MLQIDFQNAFNLVNLHSFLPKVRLHFPDIYIWVKYCYCHNPKLWTGEFMFESRTGAQQGDPFGPLLF